MTYRTRFQFDPSKRQTKACACGRSIKVTSAMCRHCSGGYALAPIAERFWPKVEKSDGCWLWVGAGSSDDGYGRIRRGRKGEVQELAHRVSYELHFGPIPDGLIVCHHCDTPRCVRPSHLFVGTYTDNMQDAIAKGRMAWQKKSARAA